VLEVPPERSDNICMMNEKEREMFRGAIVALHAYYPNRLEFVKQLKLFLAGLSLKKSR